VRIRRCLLLSLALAAVPSAACAHDPSAPASLLDSWGTDPFPLAVGVIAVASYLIGVRRVARNHPRNPVPPWRIAAWLAGIAAILVALESPLDAYADDLLSAHMVQHLLLAMVAPPLLAFGAPVTLGLRVATPLARRRLLLPVLHSRPVRILASPFVAWLAFTAVMWLVHFTPLYDAALEDPRLHVAEHTLFLVTGLLFWWPIIGADPMPGRWSRAARGAYVLAQMPVNAAVGLAIYFSPYLLYAHYAGSSPLLGVNPMTDQQVAGMVMWGIGDLILLAAFIGLAAGWVSSELRRDRRGVPERRRA
jgi:cytochrome c oxidase assembly factor CtaG